METRSLALNYRSPLLCSAFRQEIVTKRQWSALVSAVQSATIQMIDLKWLDLTDVEADQVKRIINVSCLEEVVLKWCRVRSASISDAFLSLCRDNGVTRLMINDNDVVDGPSLAVTEKAIFDYCFRTDVRHGTNKLRLSIGHVSNSFLRRLIKVVRHGFLYLPGQQLREQKNVYAICRC